MGLDSDKASHPEEREREMEEGRDILIVVFGKCFHNIQSIATSASQGEKSRFCRGKKEQVKERLKRKKNIFKYLIFRIYGSKGIISAENMLNSDLSYAYVCNEIRP